MIRDAIARLLPRLAVAPEYRAQGATLFVDLARREVRRAFTPRAVVETFLEGRGANMFYLYNLLDSALDPFHPDVPLIFGNGLLTGIVPSAARGNVTGWSPETRLLMDSNAGDYFPSFLKLNGIDRLVLFGDAADWTLLVVEKGEVSFRDAKGYVGLDNIDLRAQLERDFGGTEGKDLAMAAITRAGENRVLSAAIMAGPKCCYARGGTGAKMGALKVKAIVVRGFNPALGAGLSHVDAVKPFNKKIATEVLETGVVKHALKLRGTPFLYKPSRLLGAMGTKNNQETTWTEALDAENIDPFRPGMAGCFRCPVNCRPLNNLGETTETQRNGDLREKKDSDRKEEAVDVDERQAEAGTGADRYGAGDGPEYVTLGKFGPGIGIRDVRQVLRLNNIANDLGMDTASLGSSIAWAMELWQRGIIGARETGGLDLAWGNYDAIEKLFFMTASREGFGDTIACSARAVDEGKYPREALKYRMAVKGLFQSDPHDARIIKAFALGLAVATRGMDHLRNRATLEINAKINDDAAYKREIYGGDVSPKPTAYEGKARAVRVCEDTFAVGDSVGMCRFTTELFNSPNLPGLSEFATQLRNVTGLEFTPAALREAGLCVTGLERMVNHVLGARRADDTLPARWFDEAIAWGPYKGEKIDRVEWGAMLDEFYALTRLDGEGQPAPTFRARLAAVASGFAVTVRIPRDLRDVPGGAVVVADPVANLRELSRVLDRDFDGLGAALSSGAFAFAVNDVVILHGEPDTPLKSGDIVDVMPALAGG